MFTHQEVEKLIEQAFFNGLNSQNKNSDYKTSSAYDEFLNKKPSDTIDPQHRCRTCLNINCKIIAIGGCNYDPRYTPL